MKLENEQKYYKWASSTVDVCSAVWHLEPQGEQSNPLEEPRLYSSLVRFIFLLTLLFSFQ